MFRRLYNMYLCFYRCYCAPYVTIFMYYFRLTQVIRRQMTRFFALVSLAGFFVFFFLLEANVVQPTLQQLATFLGWPTADVLVYGVFLLIVLCLCLPAPWRLRALVAVGTQTYILLYNFFSGKGICYANGLLNLYVTEVGKDPEIVRSFGSLCHECLCHYPHYLFGIGGMVLLCGMGINWFVFGTSASVVKGGGAVAVRGTASEGGPARDSGAVAVRGTASEGSPARDALVSTCTLKENANNPKEMIGYGPTIMGVFYDKKNDRNDCPLTNAGVIKNDVTSTMLTSNMNYYKAIEAIEATKEPLSPMHIMFKCIIGVLISVAGEFKKGHDLAEICNVYIYQPTEDGSNVVVQETALKVEVIKVTRVVKLEYVFKDQARAFSRSIIRNKADDISEL